MPSSRSFPALSAAVIFRAKVTVLQGQRWLQNMGSVRYRSARSLDSQDDHLFDQPQHLVAESIKPLWTAHEEIERNLIVGKIQNLRLAVGQIDGVEFPAGATFSFWAQVGLPTRLRGYAVGRELRQGCIVPSVGGGICQLSNALYSAALDADLEIIERHAHSQIVPGSLAEIGRDATVFWNYLDLRFRTRSPLRIEAKLTVDALVVRFWAPEVKKSAAFTSCPIRGIVPPAPPNRPIASEHSCQTCNVADCFRHQPSVAQIAGQPIVYLLDEYWAEFDAYIQTTRSQSRHDADYLAIPLDGKRWKKSNYGWTVAGFNQVRQAYRQTLGRSLASRWLPAQGKARQQRLFVHDQRLARFYAQQVSHDLLHCVVMQSLLAFLWRDGWLGGRSFDVLMTRLPMAALQARLDEAYAKHPNSPTLRDFRCDRTLLELEQQALKSARHIITPHAEIAQLFPEQSILLNWQIPNQKISRIDSREPSSTLLFPASTLGRKGAYELRSVARDLGLTVRILEREFEGTDFWQGINVDRSPGDPFAGIGAVVLPAYVEHRPRMLLSAIARGIPVIASAACGLHDLPGVVIVPTGDDQALATAIKEQIQDFAPIQ
jgi:VanW like protein